MLIWKVERYLARSGMPETKFGRLAAGDPRLVSDLRNGREPRAKLTLRVEHFMNTYRSKSHAA
ncbi:hypothetical protein [Novosphingobium cyanobacteriorum]|uniref:Transcriptional regulator n=1 Tax=Novosphingobium cyanobacteriorum TaxID=3024215 RepID=A0ABT6CED5_9SPHN|nr:hypothetical protein [Novosphingobium cyanobacteriorum]MDF8332287.1 hypothetical protein [Novosphingobium cyanobacteriorum]